MGDKKETTTPTTSTPWLLALCVAATALAFGIAVMQGYIRLEPSPISLEGKKLTLRYFPARGSAEPIRLLLNDFGIEHEDIRYRISEWIDAKDDADMFPFGQMPQLSVDEESIVQSQTILRYLARALNLYGQNVAEEIQVDMIAGGAEDLLKKYTRMAYADNGEELLPEFIKSTVPYWLGKYEALLIKNGGFYGGGKHFVGKGLTWCDYMMYNAIDVARDVAPKALDSFPMLQGFMQTMEARPRLAAYLRSSKRSKWTNGSTATVKGTPMSEAQ